MKLPSSSSARDVSSPMVQNGLRVFHKNSAPFYTPWEEKLGDISLKVT